MDTFGYYCPGGAQKHLRGGTDGKKQLNKTLGIVLHIWWRAQRAWKLVFCNQNMFCIRESVPEVIIQQNDKPAQK